MSPGQIAFAHFLDRHLVWVFVPALLCWGLGFAGMMRARRPELSDKQSSAHVMAALGGLGFGLAILSVFAGQAFIERAGLADIHDRLFSTVTSATVENTPSQNVSRIVTILRQTHHVGAHHSSPTHNLRIVLQTVKGPLALDIAPDSSNPHEYWVFNPAVSEDSEIGRTYADNPPW